MNANQVPANTLEHAWRDPTKACTCYRPQRKFICHQFSQRSSTMKTSAATNASAFLEPRERIAKSVSFGSQSLADHLSDFETLV